MPYFTQNANDNVLLFSEYLIEHYKETLEKENQNPYTETVDLDIDKDLLESLTEEVNIDERMDALHESHSNWLYDAQYQSSQQFFKDNASFEDIGRNASLAQVFLEWARAQGVELQEPEDDPLSPFMKNYFERRGVAIDDALRAFYTNEQVLEEFYEEHQEDLEEAFLEALRDAGLDYFNALEVRLSGEGHITQEIEFACKSQVIECTGNLKEYLKTQECPFIQCEGSEVTITLPVMGKESEWVDFLLHLKCAPDDFFEKIVRPLKGALSFLDEAGQEEVREWLNVHEPYAAPMGAWKDKSMLSYLLQSGVSLDAPKVQDMGTLWDFLEAQEIFDNESTQLRLTINMDEGIINELIEQASYNNATLLRGKKEAYLLLEGGVVESEEGHSFKLAAPVCANLTGFVAASPDDYLEGNDAKVLASGLLKNLHKGSVPDYELRSVLWSQEESRFAKKLQEFEQDLVGVLASCAPSVQQECLARAKENMQKMESDTQLKERLGEGVLHERQEILALRVAGCFERAASAYEKNLQDLRGRLSEEKLKAYEGARTLPVPSTLHGWWQTDVYGGVESMGTWSQCEKQMQVAVKNGTLNAPDAFGRTPLHFACARLDARAVKTLLEYGAKVDVQDALGHTVFDYALKSLQQKMVGNEFNQVLEKEVIARWFEEREGAFDLKKEGVKMLQALVSSLRSQASEEHVQELLTEKMKKSPNALLYQVFARLGGAPDVAQQKDPDYRKNGKHTLSFLTPSMFAHCQQLYLDAQIPHTHQEAKTRLRL